LDGLDLGDLKAIGEVLCQNRIGLEKAYMQIAGAKITAATRFTADLKSAYSNTLSPTSTSSCDNIKYWSDENIN